MMQVSRWRFEKYIKSHIGNIIKERKCFDVEFYCNGKIVGAIIQGFADSDYYVD
jgi:hypothetical protein